MKPSPIPTLADRLRVVPNARLYVRLDVARTVFASAVNQRLRLSSMTEIETIKAELVRRGLPAAERTA